MSAPRCDEDTFISLCKRLGFDGTARHLNVNVRRVHERRRNIERNRGLIITPPRIAEKLIAANHPQRTFVKVRDGTVIVGSDGHYWPGEPSTAHKAFVRFIKELKPAVVVMNGDAFDGASISRHPPIGWENNPSVIQEIEAVQDRLSEIERAAGMARKIWTLGNHDARFETRLAAVAPEYAKVQGVHLKDHFPAWESGWSCWINDGQVVIKHRFGGGTHATHNNTLKAGVTIVTGHLHSLKVTPFSDYNGDRWGVDTGTLADPYGPQFRDYTEDSPRNHRSGFVVLTFVDGQLLWPEVVSVVDRDRVSFRGQLIEVGPCESTPRREGASRAGSLKKTKPRNGGSGGRSR